MNREDPLDRLRRHAAAIRKRYGVRRLSVFGSVAQGTAREGSDVDVLVEFDSPARFDVYMDLKFHLEELLGVSVDLVTPKALRPRLRARIEQEAIDVP